MSKWKWYCVCTICPHVLINLWAIFYIFIHAGKRSGLLTNQYPSIHPSIHQVKHRGWNSGCVWYFLRLICKTNGAAVTSTHTEHFFSSFSSGMEVGLALSGLHSKQTQPCSRHRQVVLAASAVFTSSWAWRGSPPAACPAETCPVHFGYRAETLRQPFINTLVNKAGLLCRLSVYGLKIWFVTDCWFSCLWYLYYNELLCPHKIQYNPVII